MLVIMAYGDAALVLTFAVLLAAPVVSLVAATWNVVHRRRRTGGALRYQV